MRLIDNKGTELGDQGRGFDELDEFLDLLYAAAAGSIEFDVVWMRV